MFNEGGKSSVLLTDLSKAFDYMTHYLLLAKLPALRYDMNGLNWIFDHLMGRDQRVKSNLFLAHT